MNNDKMSSFYKAMIREKNSNRNAYLDYEDKIMSKRYENSNRFDRGIDLSSNVQKTEPEVKSDYGLKD